MDLSVVVLGVQVGYEIKIVHISNGAPNHLWLQNAALYRPSFSTIALPAAPAGSAPSSPSANAALLPPTRGDGCVLQSTRAQLVVDLFGVWR